MEGRASPSNIGIHGQDMPVKSGKNLIFKPRPKNLSLHWVATFRQQYAYFKLLNGDCRQEQRSRFQPLSPLRYVFVRFA